MVYLANVFDFSSARLFGKGEGVLFNVGGQTGKDCLLTWADGVKVTDRRDRTRSLSLRKRCTNHCTMGPLGSSQTKSQKRKRFTEDIVRNFLSRMTFFSRGRFYFNSIQRFKKKK